jgi:serine/threonine-protein kinase
MRKYQLSAQYQLAAAADMTDDAAGVAQLAQEQSYGLLDTASGECVVINSTMYLFLNQYTTPKTLHEVAQFFAHEFDSTPEEVLPIVRQFFKDMKERGVIASPSKVERCENTTPYAVGTLMGHYRLEENLSTNLPLEVYKATDLETGQSVVLKMLRIPKQLPEERRAAWREKFKKEFQIQAILRGSPNVCQLLNLTPDYAVLEWIEGVSLRRHLAECGGFDTERYKTFLTQLFDSYAFMHKKNILHGDVHVRNILVTNDNQLKIIDFDLAHHLVEGADFPLVGGGMPEFVAPENVQFDAFDIVKGKANFRTEVYQLGIIAYWLIYGKVPFSGAVWQDLATDILNKPVDFPLLSSRGDAVSLEMRSFLKKSLSRRPKNRFSSAQEMTDTFAALLSEKKEDGNAPQKDIAVNPNVQLM